MLYECAKPQINKPQITLNFGLAASNLPFNDLPHPNTDTLAHTLSTPIVSAEHPPCCPSAHGLYPLVAAGTNASLLSG